jgi:hypothetical protein
MAGRDQAERRPPRAWRRLTVGVDNSELFVGVGRPQESMPEMVSLSIVKDGDERFFWLLPNSARSLASDLIELADEVERTPRSDSD